MKPTSRWKTFEVDPEKVAEVQKTLGWPVPLVRAIVRRGVEGPEDLDAYLHPRLSSFPDPMQIPGMDIAANRLWDAILQQQQIVVHGDYDVDGITSTALLVRVLKVLGATVTPYLPHRVDDGYGLSSETVTHCISSLGAELIVTVDCGTGSREAVKVARDLGVEVIVTDHHLPPDDPAEPLALLNPQCSDLPEWQVFAGVGVAFMLCFGLVKVGRNNKQPSIAALNLKSYLDLVALGTVADMVPLKGYNRAIVRTGLQSLERTSNEGLKALIKVAKLETPFTAQDIGFGLGPRLNAAGRLGTAQTSLNLLLTENLEEAQGLAEELHETNRERRIVEKEALDEAIEQIESAGLKHELCLVVAKQGWHPGVIGIVASRLARKYSRPALVIALDDNGKGKGSCRSIEAFHMVQALDACSSHLSQHGGHHMAAGFSIAEESVPSFREELNRYAVERLRQEDLTLTITHDGEMDIGELDSAFMDHVEELAPFGSENPDVCWVFKQVQILSSRIVGENHLKVQVGSGTRSWNAIGFGFGEWVDYEGAIDFVATPFVNRFRGRVTIELRILDLSAVEKS